MKKILFIFILVVLNYIIFVYAREKRDGDTYSNDIKIEGINKERFLISYYEGIKNFGKGDIKYQYIIFDYRNNSIVEKSSAKYIAQLYGEESILTDWSDLKYSFSAYYNFLKSQIDEMNHRYNIIHFAYLPVSVSSQSFKILSRESKDGLLENLNYLIDFRLDSKKYTIQKSEYDVCEIMDINIFAIYTMKNILIVVLQKKHKGFEGDEYFDFEIIGCDNL